MSMSTEYRDSVQINHRNDSSDEGELPSEDSDSDDPTGGSKRSRLAGEDAGDIFLSSMSSNTNLSAGQRKKSKNNKIWENVLTDQSSKDISSSLGAIGMRYSISRGPESFDIPVTFKNGTVLRDEVANPGNSFSKEEKCSASRPQELSNAVGSIDCKKKRKRQKKKIFPTYKPGQKVTLNKRCELSDTDPVDKVSEEIAFRLWEPKKDFIRSITETLGVASAINFYEKTEDIERGGGLLTRKGDKRRTPGGTFLYLIRNDPNLDQDAITTVFNLESERERIQRKGRPKKTKKTEQSSGPMEITTLGAPQDAMAPIDGVLLCPPAKEGQKAISHDGFNDKKGGSNARTTLDVNLSVGEIADSDDENAQAFG